MNWQSKQPDEIKREEVMEYFRVASLDELKALRTLSDRSGRYECQFKSWNDAWEYIKDAEYLEYLLRRTCM